MATGDSILDGLGGLQFSPLENPYGIGAATLATSLPKLINPSGNFGTNLGIALGGTLLTSLMGYQAKQTAADLSSRASQLGLDIMAAKTPEERMTMANAADTGFYGPEVKSKALSLVNALEGQKKINELAAQQQYDTKLKELQALTSSEGQEYIGLQTDKMLQGIGARGLQTRLNQAQNAELKAAQTVLKANVDANLGWLKNDQVRQLKADLAADKVARLANNEEPDLIEAQQLAYTKAFIDKEKQKQKQVYDLQKIEFEKKLSDSLKQGELGTASKEVVNKAQNVANAAYDIANYIEEQVTSYPQLYAGRNYSAADDNALKERLQILRDEYKIYSTGAAAGKLEMQLYDSIISGDFTAGLPSQLQNLRALGDVLSQKSMTILQNANKSSSEIYNDIVAGFSNKRPVQYGMTIPEPKTPERPQPAVIGSGLASGLQGAPSGTQTQIMELEAQKQQLVDAVNSKTLSFEEGRTRARAIQAQIDTLKGGM